MTNIRDNEIPDLKVGDVIYECEGGINIEVRVESVPVEEEGHEGRRFWCWTAENTQDGTTINYSLTEGLSCYGPRLYRSPQYARIDPKTKEFIFELYGEVR